MFGVLPVLLQTYSQYDMRCDVFCGILPDKKEDPAKAGSSYIFL